MSEILNILLFDKQIRPTDEYISSIIGVKKKLWQILMNHLGDNYPDSSGE